MAHECPICYLNCHCGGDIDDMCFDGTKEQMMCTHCNEDDGEDDEDYICPECGEWNGDHYDNCSQQVPVNDEHGH